MQINKNIKNILFPFDIYSYSEPTPIYNKPGKG